MSCEEAEAVFAGAALGAVEPHRLAGARAHATTCEQCSTSETRTREAASLLAIAVLPVAPPSRLRRRIVDAVWRERTRATHTQRARTLGRAASALALAAALVLGGMGLADHLHRAEPRVDTVALTPALSKPNLSGTLLYDGASHDIVVTVRGLPVQASAVYQLWLVRADRTVAAAGVLQPQPDGAWRAAVIRPSDAFTTLAATLEPAPDAIAPSGPQLFQASIPAG